MDYVLKSGYYESPSGYNKINCFVDEVLKLENKVTFYFESTDKYTIKSRKEEKDYRNKTICRFFEKEILPDKIRDHCRLTDKYREPAHTKRYINVTQKGSNFSPFIFNNFSNYDCHLFFKKVR